MRKVAVFVKVGIIKKNEIIVMYFCLLNFYYLHQICTIHTLLYLTLENNPHFFSVTLSVVDAVDRLSNYNFIKQFHS